MWLVLVDTVGLKSHIGRMNSSGEVTYWYRCVEVATMASPVASTSNEVSQGGQRH